MDFHLWKVVTSTHLTGAEDDEPGDYFYFNDSGVDIFRKWEVLL